MKSKISIDLQTEVFLMESFSTIQGEGFHQGKAAWFIRLAGCDVGCVWCDVKESWHADESQIRSIADIIAEASAYKSRMAVVTGGEPLLYDLDALTQALHRVGFRTHLETSGAYPLTGTWDWICLSPKKFKQPMPEIFNHANELKIIVFNKSDLNWAEDNAAKVSQSCKLYLQPEWDKSEQMLPLIVDYIKTHPQWELSLQIHKYLNLP